MPVQAQAQPSQGSASAAAQQRKNLLRSFRRNTRKRYAQWNYGLQNIAFNGNASATAPQVGLASRVWIQFRLAVSDSAASPSVTKLARGPFNFVQRIQFVTNLGSNNIWDCDGWNTYVNNLSKSASTGRNDYGYNNGFDNAFGTSDYANDPWYQYVTPTVQNTQYNICFTLRIDLTPNPGMNFTQGLLNLQAPQVQASINCVFGPQSSLFTTADTLTINSGSANIWYEYFEIPNPLRNVQLPSGMLHCTLEQNTPILATGVTTYTIPRQGILLRLQQETVLNSVLAKGGPVGAAGNAGTAGIDNYQLQLNNSDTIYNRNYELQKQLMREEFPSVQSFNGMDIFENFGALGIDEPCRGDLRDAIDTEAVTTTAFNTTIDSAATLGGTGTNYINSTREILLPFNTQAAGQQVA